MNENDFVVGVLTYITCLREKKRYSTAKSYQPPHSLLSDFPTPTQSPLSN